MPTESMQRDDLIRLIDRANAGAGVGLVWRGAVVLIALVFTDWQRVLADPAPAGVFLLVLFGRYLFDLVPLIGRKRKLVNDLRPETTLGEHNRESLLALVSEVEKRLDVPPGRYPVYLTRDKSLNAAAVSLGLDALLGRVDGVYLNRQTLHVLGPDELAFVIGHELGHCDRYYLRSTRWEALNLTLVAAVGLALLPVVDRWSWVGVFGLGLFAAGALAWLRVQSLASMRVIEHLCDDHGARAAGVPQGVNALLKIAAESEITNRITRFCFEVGKKREDLDPVDLMQEYERLAPFGKLDAKEAERLLAQSVREVQQRNKTFSLSGLLEYLNDEEVDEEAVDEMKALWRKLDDAHVIDWSKPLREGNATRLSATQIDQVVEALRSHPAALLSRTPEEVLQESTHPPTRQRVLYLWENRPAIESAG